MQKISRVILLPGYNLGLTPCPFSGPALSRSLTQSHTPKLCFRHFEFNHVHCRAIMAAADLREIFDIELQRCGLTTEGEPIFFDGIRRDLGLSSLKWCHFNTRPLAEALRGNTRTKEFGLYFSHRISEEELHFLLQALAENLGIEDLDIDHTTITDEGWCIMCQSLATHPALQHLSLCDTSSHDAGSWGYRGLLNMSETRKTHRTQCLVEMLKVNTVVKHIHMRDAEYDETIWRDEIIPRLEMNELQSRIVAVKKTQGTLRAPLFGRALHTIPDNNTFLFMMVKGNIDLFAGVAHDRTRKCRKRTRYGK